MPGEVWSHQLATSTLCIILVVPQMRNPHHVLLLDRKPIHPPFNGFRAAYDYAHAEWMPIGHREISR